MVALIKHTQMNVKRGSRCLLNNITPGMSVKLNQHDGTFVATQRNASPPEREKVLFLSLLAFSELLPVNGISMESRGFWY